MNWSNQQGSCVECGMTISTNDFITGVHDVVCEKQKSSK